MITREQLINSISRRGPVVPSDLTSELKENTIIIGAFLSELVSSKKLLLTSAKIGGSPLYFLESQRPQIVKLYPYLNEKDRRTFDLLQSSKILFDEEQTPLVRASLRMLPDFANGMKVTYKGKELYFWKWFLISDEEATVLIKESLVKLFPEEEKQAETIVPPASAIEVPPVEKPSPKTSTEFSAEDQNIPAQNNISAQSTPSSQSTSEKSQPKENVPAKAHSDSKKSDVQNVLVPQEDPFVIQIISFLSKKSIKLSNILVLKKNSDFGAIATIPSQIGDITYYCRARNKKRSNEGDLAAAYVEGQMKNIPVLYVSCGDLPKKVQELLHTKYKNIKVLKWE
jgi:hypothetical protein